MERFRPKKKVGQLYINIPGEGWMSFEANPDKPHYLDDVLRLVEQAFFDAYIGAQT